MESHTYKEMFAFEGEHWWFRGRRAIIRSLLRSFIVSPVPRALDIGCGTGFNMRLLEEFVASVTGLDGSREALRLAKARRPDGKFIRGTFPGAHLPEQYDLITLFDVLEHIEDDAAALKAVHGFLAPGGIAVMTVPAFPLLWSEHDVVLHHYRRYTKRRLVALVREQGSFVLERTGYFNCFLLPPLFLVRLFRKLVPVGRGATDFFPLPKAANRVLEAIFKSEAPFMRSSGLPVGVSLFAVVRKPLTTA